jgi:hypothetical protein
MAERGAISCICKPAKEQLSHFSSLAQIIETVKILLQRSQERFRKLGEICVDTRLLDVDDNIATPPASDPKELKRFVPHYLAQSPFAAVSDHCVSEFARSRDSKTRRIPFGGENKDREKRRMEFRTALVDRLKLLSRTQGPKLPSAFIIRSHLAPGNANSGSGSIVYGPLRDAA